MKKSVLLLASVVGILLNGCAGNYNIEPQFNQEEKTLTIAGKDFHGAKIVLSRDPLVDTSSRFNKKIRKYLLKNDECNSVFYEEISAGRKAYLWGNFEDFLTENFINKENGICDVTKYSNVRFFNCYTEAGVYKTGNFISTRVSNAYGYTKISDLALDRKCFYSIKEYFDELAKKEKIEKVEYKLK
jgi:hypothetical protein